MQNAYELKALGQMIVDEAKVEGLTLAEESLEKLGKAVYIGLKKWARESAALSDTKIDDFIAPFYDQMDQFVDAQIEKIDLDGSGS